MGCSGSLKKLIDTAWMPCASIGGSRLLSADSGRPLAMPSICVGIEQTHRGALGRQRRLLDSLGVVGAVHRFASGAGPLK